MRISVAFGMFAALLGASAFAASTTATYHVVYGAKDLGTWTTMSTGRQKNGAYTGGPAFDISTGPGFPTVTVTRTMLAGDQSITTAFPSPNVALTVTAMKAGKAMATTTCAKANAFSSGTQGDPGKGTTTVEFACAAIVSAKAH